MLQLKSHCAGGAGFAWRTPARARAGCAVLALLTVFACTVAEARERPVASEYEVKAAFLYNFTKFVQWPSEAFSSPESPLVIGVLGEDPFGGVLDEAVRGQTADGRPLAVRRFRPSDDLTGCHILFISDSERRRLAGVLEDLRTRPVLTVGDVDGFARQGGVINFVMEANRVRFQINVDAARRSELKLHSSLLNLARIVRDER